MEVDAEDDAVVMEIPVYLATQLAAEMHVLQFPLRPADRLYDDAHHNAPTAAVFKPKVQRLELEVPISTGANYDADVARRLGTFYQPIESTGFAPEPMRTQRLASTIVPSKTHYVVGVCKNNELHLTPVRSVLQMRPSLAYLDEQDARRKENDKPVEEEAEDSTGEEEMKAVQVQFKRRESERAQAARKRSHAYLQKQFDDEAWVHMTYHDERSEEADALYNQLIAVDQSNIVLETSKAEYLNALIPPPVSMKDHRQLSSGAGIVSMHELKKMTLEERVKKLLISMQVVSFDRLREVALMQDDVATLIAALNKHACLVQGNWVVKSDLVATGRIAVCRDYLLYLLAQNRVLARRDFSDATDLPSETVKELLTGVARLKHTVGWEFKLPTDEAFLQKNPEVVTRQRILMEAAYVQIAKTLGFKPSKLNKDKERDAAGAAVKPEGGARSGSESDSGPAAAVGQGPIPVVGATRDEQLQNCVLEVLRRGGVCALNYIVAKVELFAKATDLANNLVATGPAPSLREVEYALEQVGRAVGSEGAYVCKVVDPTNGPAQRHYAEVVRFVSQHETFKKVELTTALKTQLGKEYQVTVATHEIDRICVQRRIAGATVWSLREPRAVN